MAKRKNPGSIRADYEVYNEATGFLLTSASMAGKGFISGEPEWAKAAAQGLIIPVELAQDDPFVIRVLVDEELTDAEKNEWVGALEAPLDIPDGRLIAAGGIEYIEEPADSPIGRMMGDYIHEIAAPPGRYTAELYAYIHGINGFILLNGAAGGDEKRERMGAWFRRTRSGEKPPVWLENYLRNHPMEDPGHEDDWTGGRGRARKQGYIDFLLRLAKLEPAPLSLPPMEQGFYSFNAWKIRAPERCPMGIRAKNPARSLKVRPEEKGRYAEPNREWPDVLSRIGGRKPLPVAGGPAQIPISALASLYALGWFAYDSQGVELRISGPEGRSIELGASPADTEFEVMEAGVRIRISPELGRWGGFPIMDKLAGAVSKAPEGATLDFIMAPMPDEEQSPEMGIAWFRGELSNGQYRIDSAWPRLETSALDEMLRFAQEAVEGKRLSLQSQEEAEMAIAFAKKDESLFAGNPIKRDKNSAVLKKKDASLLLHIGAQIFRKRWGALIPCYTETEDDLAAEAEFEAAMKKLGEAAVQFSAKKGKETADSGAELVFEGIVGKFFRVDIYKKQPLDAELFQNTDRQLKNAGYDPIGDLICDRFGDVVIRGFVKTGGDSWAALLSGMLESDFNFVTYYPDGASLTTGIKAGQGDDAEQSLFRSHHPEINFLQLGKLLEKHEKRKAVLARKHGAPEPASADLKALAQKIDASVARQMGMG